MPDQAEIKRIRHEGLAPTLPYAKWEVQIDLGQHSDEVWERIVSVGEFLLAYDYDNWPDEAFWRAVLPAWLSCFMMTEEECRIAITQTPRERWDELGWGSDRGLMRYASGTGNGGVINDRETAFGSCWKVAGNPPRIDAFKQLSLASGATILAEDYD